MTIQFKCEACGGIFESDAEATGTTQICPLCAQTTVLVSPKDLKQKREAEEEALASQIRENARHEAERARQEAVLKATEQLRAAEWEAARSPWTHDHSNFHRFGCYLCIVSVIDLVISVFSSTSVDGVINVGLLHNREVGIHLGLAGLIVSFLSMILAALKAVIHNQSCTILLQKDSAQRASATGTAA